MARLYEIADELAHALRLADDADGELPEGLDALLDGLTLGFGVKVEQCCKARAQYLADAAAVKGELDRLTAIHRRAEGRAEWLKNYLRRCLEHAGVDRFEAGTFKLRFQKNSVPSISLVVGAEIPEAYKVTRVELDKQQVAADWRAGKELPLTVIVTVGQHLRIS